MITAMKTAAIIRLLVLLFFYDYAASLIIPEELPTILSLIYSNIPPIKKGTDSRLGMGFRLGEHADFQILVELGPQSETDPIGMSDNAKKRRNAMLSAAMRGELGPFARAVAKYQVERKIRNETDKPEAATEDKLKNNEAGSKPNDQSSASSNWLTKWKEEMSVPSSLLENADDSAKVTRQRIGKPAIKSTVETNQLNELIKLYKLQNVNKTENLNK